jgi:hypothetical protein
MEQGETQGGVSTHVQYSSQYGPVSLLAFLLECCCFHTYNSYNCIETENEEAGSWHGKISTALKHHVCAWHAATMCLAAVADIYVAWMLCQNQHDTASSAAHLFAVDTLKDAQASSLGRCQPVW